MNTRAYEWAYKIARLADNLAEQADQAAGMVTNKLSTLADWLEAYANEVRKAADDYAADNLWEKVTDNVESNAGYPDVYRINITGKTPAEIAAEIRRLLEDVSKVKAAPVETIDQLLQDIFNKEEEEEE